MEQQTNKSTHPIVIIAGVAVTIFSIVGVGAIMGWIPTSGAKTAEPAALSAPATASSGTLGAPAAVSADAASAPQPQAQYVPPAPPKAEHRVVEHHKPVQVARVTPPEAMRDAEPRYAPPPPPVARAICLDCGVIESVRAVEKQGDASALGTVAGGVAGGVLGHQMGNGRGRDVMTVLGAVGGAFAGREVEKQVKKTKSYEIEVRFENGSTRTLTQSSEPTWRTGDHVRVINGEIVSNT